jgi:S-adenosylmethionine:tRNA ribosyltransferase-isomerase
MQTSEFDFTLDEKYIAQTPLENRSDSKLFLLNTSKKSFQHKKFTDITEILTENDVLVFNESRVIPARIKLDFIKYNREIFLISPNREKNSWKCMVHPGRRMPEGRLIQLPDGAEAKITKVHEDGMRDILFTKTEDFYAWLQKHAKIPQPPYIKKQINEPERYQSVMASQGNSVASPTASLHFTKEIIKKLEKKGVEICKVLLDVGAGTFLPVKTDSILNHKMHAENYLLTEKNAEILNKAKKAGKRIIAVGTTANRVLETCTDKQGEIKAGSGETDLFIYPGYKFKFTDALITNFHTPKSTLLMLVSAFAGKDLILKAYKEAQKENYRFYSFGDSMFIEK